LFRSYQAATERLGGSVRDRTVVVVYTKADQYDFHDRAVSDYLTDDPFQGVLDPGAAIEVDRGFSLGRYMDGLEKWSRRLREFTLSRVRGGAALVHAAEGRGVRLKFCVTSALGQTPNRSTHELVQPATPYRVLDPLLLSLLDREPPPPPERIA